MLLKQNYNRLKRTQKNFTLQGPKLKQYTIPTLMKHYAQLLEQIAFWLIQYTETTKSITSTME